MNSTRFTSGSRHGWIDNLCQRLERVVWGQEADKLLTDPASLPESGAVVRLPVWHWATPGIDVGRKAVTDNGGSMLLPVRVTRDGGHLAVVGNGTSEIHHWSATGMGVDVTGGVEVTCTPMATGAEPVTTTTTTAVAIAAGDRSELIRRLQGMVSDGNQARWSVILGLEPYVKAAVNAAHGYVCAELAGPNGASRPVLDPNGLQKVSDTLLLGELDSATGDRHSSVARLVDRCLGHTTFQRVDPQLYIRRALRRDAEQQIRVSVGDPRIGPKIRAIQRELQSTSVEEIIAVYQQRHPHDELGARRAIAALATPVLLTGLAGYDRALAAEFLAYSDEDETP